MLIGFSGVGLRLGRRVLFDGVDLQIAEGDRVGLIGRNGSGKTSLLRIVASELDADEGLVHRAKGLRIGYLPQDIMLEGNRQLLPFMRANVPGRDELQSRLDEVERALSGADNEDEQVSLSTELAELQELVAHFDTTYADHTALRILAGLGFQASDGDRPLGEFSGGWQMRALLAALLFMRPDVLLLDEPTNHLDMPTVAFFGDFLRRYHGAFVLISHDREFLNEQINRVVSLEPEGLRTYRGNYESYLSQRAQEEEILINREKNQRREREKAEEFINRFRAQATKAKAVQSRIKALERMGDVSTLKHHNRVSFKFPPTARTSKQVLTVKGLQKAFGDNQVLQEVDLSAARGDRIAITGVNGAGKTTLLKILAGELDKDAGEIIFGHHVQVGYYAQHHTEMLDPEATVYEEVARAAEGQAPTAVRTLLGSLLFSADDIDKRVHVLSGGERARVALAKLLIKSYSLLLMDEPTNHLDLASSEQLADALATFDGTLIFVSHNRGFVRQLATKIWDAHARRVNVFPGTLDEYLTSSLARVEGGSDEPLSIDKADKRVSRKEQRRQASQERERRRKLVGPLQKKASALEDKITELETLQTERSHQLEDPTIFSDPKRSSELLRAFQADATVLEELNSAWEVAETAYQKALAELEEQV